MNRSLSISCSLFLALLLFAGCQKDSSDDPNNIIIDIPKDFDISLQEDLNSNKRGLSFEIKTINEKYCEDSRVTYHLNNSNNSIIYSLNEIDPLDCQGNEPARASVVVDNLVNGIYNLQINLKEEIINEGMLHISDVDYTIEMDDPIGFNLLHHHLRKIPDNTIWGFVGYDSNEFTNTAENYIKAVEFISHESEAGDGFYGHFNIENDIVDFDFEINHNKVLSYIFTYDKTNRQELLDILEDYRSNYGNNLTIRLFTDTGEEL